MGSAAEETIEGGEQQETTKAKRQRAKKKVAHLAIVDPHLPRAEQENAAAKRIARAAAEVERIDGDLSNARKEWNELAAKQRAALKGAIESGDSGGDATAREKLNAILQNWQALQETEAGRKDALAELLTQKTEARKRLRESFETARQMEFAFDDGVDASDEDARLAAAAADPNVEVF